jgi:hypothetical protein
MCYDPLSLPECELAPPKGGEGPGEGLNLKIQNSKLRTQNSELKTQNSELHIHPSTAVAAPCLLIVIEPVSNGESNHS